MEMKLQSALITILLMLVYRCQNPPISYFPAILFEGKLSEFLYAVPVANEEMKKLFDNLNNNACGWDEFDSRVIKST